MRSLNDVTPLEIPQELLDAVDYEDGVLRWNTKRGKVNIGDVAGSRCKHNSIRLMFRGKKYLVHRVVWAKVKGEQPPSQLDHINRDPSDNRIENLRAASSEENGRNRTVGKDNKSGTTGVSWNTQVGKWKVSISIEKDKKHLGYYAQLKEAVMIRKAAEDKYYGEFAPKGGK